MILFVAIRYSPFVRSDLQMLERHFEVRCFRYAPSRRLIRNLWNQFALFFWLARHILKARAVFLWFADYHTLLPVLFSRLFGRLSLLILGGYDVNTLPEIGYGALLNPVRAFFVRQSIRHADCVVPVDPSLAAAAWRRVPRLRGSVEAVPTGYDTAFWSRVSNKDDCVLTVGHFDSRQTWILKGVDLFLETARRLPKHRFVIAGVDPHRFSDNAWPSNVNVLPMQSPSQLRSLYSRAKVYAQFSMTEGLPNAVCEAMLCECIPVGSAVGGIPAAVGSSGFLLRTRDADEAARLIRQALNAPSSLGKSARRRAVQLFRMELRERAIVNRIRSLRPGLSGKP